MTGSRRRLRWVVGLSLFVLGGAGWLGRASRSSRVKLLRLPVASRWVREPDERDRMFTDLEIRRPLSPAPDEVLMTRKRHNGDSPHGQYDPTIGRTEPAARVVLRGRGSVEPISAEAWDRAERISVAGAGHFGTRGSMVSTVRLANQEVQIAGKSVYSGSAVRSPGKRFVAVLSEDWFGTLPSLFPFLGGDAPVLIHAHLEVFDNITGERVAWATKRLTRWRPGIFLTWLGDQHLFVLRDGNVVAGDADFPGESVLWVDLR